MPEPTRSLPSRPSLDQQKKLAKELFASFRAHDPQAIARIREHLPDKQKITLADAQLSLAREYGLPSWAALKAHIASLSRPVSDAARQELHDAFVGRDWAAVRRVFANHPSLRAHLDDPVFPFDTPALVQYAADQDLDAVDLLLELGADPNRRTGWWAGGFHPLHWARGAVADRLMAAGSVADACGAAQMDRLDLLEKILKDDPSRVHERGGDGQTPLHFARSREAVDLLLAHGADIDALDVDHRSAPAHWMLQGKRGAGRYALAAHLVERGAAVDVFLAAALGLVDRLEQILEQDPSVVDLRTGKGAYGEKPPSSFHIYTWTLGQYLSPLQVAAQFEQPEALDVLRRRSSPKDRLLAACAAARAEEVADILREWPDLVAGLGPEDARALPEAGWNGNAAAVDLMLSVGFDPATDGQDRGTVLHCAAWQGAADCVEVALRHPGVRALIERRDAVHHSTPLGWCCHGARWAKKGGDYPRIARLLLEAGAKPGPNLDDAPEDVRAVIRAYGLAP
ncbi:MAG: ankyrin repeat domain-containing protein [Gemmatimonadales bacterium]